MALRQIKLSDRLGTGVALGLNALAIDHVACNEANRGTFCEKDVKCLTAVGL
jgi:hypothetical protein